MRIAICDDEAAELNITVQALEEYMNIRKLPARIDTFTKANELLFADPFDIYILDVVMPDMNGIDIGRQLRSLGHSGIIIYLTTSKDYAVDSYDTDAFHYLLKPIDKKRLFEVLDKAVSILQGRDECVYIKTKEGTIRIPLNDIYYAELKGRAVRYVCCNGIFDSMTSSLSFREMVSSLLSDRRFFLCGASLALNLSHIRMVDRISAELSSGQRIDIPRLAAKDLYLAWSDYWLE